ncbi:MAG TPA: DUF4350 domain-containing protein [Candidatus Binatia bacterium]|nr:DUF4350 domain-containing protein [Candidatus Binatia bacterium]
MKSGLYHWLVLAIATVGLAGSMVMVEALAGRSVWRIDLTPDKAYTLAEHSQRVLRDLQRDVRVTAFLRAEDSRNHDIEDLLWRVSTVTRRVQYAVIDINRNPAVARQYGVNSDGSLVVESGGRRKIFANPSEPLLIGAIMQVSRPSRKRVYVVTGHGERSVTDSDRRRGLTTARATLSNEFYDVESLSVLAGAAVPDDADALVIAGPHADFLPAELLTLGEYLARGGGLLVLLDPEECPSLVAFLRTYHVVVGDDVVVDPDNRLFAGDFLTMVIPGRSPSHPVSAALAAPPLFAQARPVEVLADASGRFGATVMLEASASSWRSGDRDAVHSGQTVFLPGRDRRGPVPVAVSVIVRPEAGNAPPGRLIVAGDSDFANNFFIEYLGNKDLLVNMVNWLAHEEQFVGVRPQQQQPGVNQFFVSARQGRLAFWLLTVVQPMLFLVVGLAVFMRRRFTG